MNSSADRTSEQRHVGMRVWLAAGFTLVCVLTAAIVYLFINDSSGKLLSERATELALGRTSRLADRITEPDTEIQAEVEAANGEGFAAWYFDVNGELVAPKRGAELFTERENYQQVLAVALTGLRTTKDIAEGQVTLVGIPVGDGGAVIGRYSRPVVLSQALDRLRSKSLRAALIAVLIGTLLGVAIASLITRRLKRLAATADELASGDFDVYLPVWGRDEIADLARSLDSMRLALKESFRSLRADRDELTAIFDGLGDAVFMIDDVDGSVRYRNSAASDLLDEDGRPPEPMRPVVERAALKGFAAHPAIRIGDKAYALQARALPDDRAVLTVARDRTEEMRKEFSERDFISNAAHELRNPLAGISSAIEVLQTGAKDDPEARDHFLDRLATDVDRMSRLTRSLLTLARVDAIGAGEVEVVDIPSAVEDVCARVELPVGIDLRQVVEDGLAAKADPVLLRQVVIGLLTNAIKNTPPPGKITVRAGRVEDDHVLIEVVDTGVGIPEAEVERVFERFYRRSPTRSQEGFGLGLALARRMVDVMDGTIGAHSKEGEGSTFWVRLPVAEPSETPVA